MTTVVITQPMYFPWVGLISQFALADVLVWLDDAQFTRNSFTHRVQTKSEGKQRWLTIPLQHKGSRHSIIQLESASPDWYIQHVEDFSMSAEGSDYLADALENITGMNTTGSVCDRIIASAQACFSAISKTTPNVRTYRSSEMEVDGSGWRRILDLVHAVGGTRYLTGHGAANYLDHAAFEAEGVTVDYMGYDFAPWPQAHGAFSPYVTSLDLIAHVSPQDRFRHLSTQTIPWRDFLTSKGLPINR